MACIYKIYECIRNVPIVCTCFIFVIIIVNWAANNATNCNASLNFVSKVLDVYIKSQVANQEYIVYIA